MFFAVAENLQRSTRRQLTISDDEAEFFLLSGSNLDNVLVLGCKKFASTAKSKYGYQYVGLPETKENLICTELSPAVRWIFRPKQSVFM
jgi:hypothetical protein